MIRRLLKALNEHADFITRMLLGYPEPVRIRCTKCTDVVGYDKHHCNTQEL